MTYFGTTMLVNGVQPGQQIIEHRMLSYVDPNLPDNDIKHKLLYEHYTDFAFSKPIKLDDVLTDCKKYNIIPIVNICATEGSWKGKGITPDQYGKIGGIIRDILKERGFKKGLAYQSGFNEPGKVLSTDQTIEYTNALHDEVGEDYDVVYGNDEFNMLDWNKMGANCKAKVMGIHHLSSLGTWDDPKKYFSNIIDCKTIANTYGKEIIGSECGSWFKDYCKEGHQINLDIMAECKKYDYLGCLIVLPDINQKSKLVWKLLGYRIFKSDFTTMISGSQSKYDEFINYMKTNGTKPKEEIMEYIRPQMQQLFYQAMGWEDIPYHENTPSLPIVGRKVETKSLTWADFDAVFETLMKGLIEALKENNALPVNFPEPMSIKYNPDGSWNNNWKEIAKSGGEI